MAEAGSVAVDAVAAAGLDLGEPCFDVFEARLVAAVVGNDYEVETVVAECSGSGRAPRWRAAEPAEDDGRGLRPAPERQGCRIGGHLRCDGEQALDVLVLQAAAHPVVLGRPGTSGDLPDSSRLLSHDSELSISKLAKCPLGQPVRIPSPFSSF